MAKEPEVVLGDDSSTDLPSKDGPDLYERKACDEVAGVGELQDTVNLRRARLDMVMLGERA
ncbi:MAG: hypothetical protein HY268_25940 [Deltaproteobacteria bacterium]|nr:hypothetical protein [Deltaproteobacteria bacterium]